MTMKKIFGILIGCTFLFSVSSVGAQQAGKAIVERECGKCHGLSKVTKANKDDAAWEKTLDRMIKKGANVAPGEKDAALKYLRTLNR